MLLIVDANVLIDYLKADESILQLAAAHLGTVHVPREIIDEVDQIDDSDCERLGLEIVAANTDQLLEAGSSSGKLSFEDWVCFILARDNSWTCVSNDLPLHKNCQQAGVSSMWGLELLLELASQKHLSRTRALQVAEKIRQASGKRVTEAIVAEFKQRLD